MMAMTTLSKRAKIKYPPDYNPILEYHAEIESGREVVSLKIKTLYRKLVHDLNNPDEFFYSHARANHIIEYFENYLKHSKGK